MKFLYNSCEDHRPAMSWRGDWTSKRHFWSCRVSAAGSVVWMEVERGFKLSRMMAYSVVLHSVGRGGHGWDFALVWEEEGEGDVEGT